MSVTVVNPATEERIAELEQAGVEETDAAVARAETAFAAWHGLDGYSEVKNVFIAT